MLETKCNSLPTNIYIEPTNFCNNECYMCTSRIMSRDKGLMTMDIYEKIIAQLVERVPIQNRNTVKLVLIGQGEPLINVNIYDMIKLAKKEGFMTEIITNCILLNDNNIEKLISSGIDIVNVSWYAFDDDTYRNIYGKSDYSVYLKNLFSLFHYINTHNCKTTVGCVWMASEYNKVDNPFANWFYNRLPIERVRGHRVRNYRKSFEKIGITETDTVMNALNEHKVKYPEDNLVGVNCMYDMIYIHWDGEVYPCIIDYNGEYLVGKIEEENILDIWNNDRMQEFRRKVITGEEFSEGVYCKDCTAGVPKSIALKSIQENTYIKYSYRNNNEFNKLLKKQRYDEFKMYFPEQQPEIWASNLEQLKDKWEIINQEAIDKLNTVINKCISILEKEPREMIIIGEMAECMQCADYIEQYKGHITEYELMDRNQIESLKERKNEIILICDYQNSTEIQDILVNEYKLNKELIVNMYEQSNFNFFYLHRFDDFNMMGQYKYKFSL